MFKHWILLLLVALAIRVGLSFYWQARVEHDFFFGDSNTYWVLARHIAQNEPYEYEGLQMMRMPGYPMLLAPLFMVFGNDPPILIARFENCLFGVLTVVMVAAVAFTLFRDQRIAFLAGAIAAIEPCNAFASVLILSEAPFSFAMMLQIFAWINMLKSETIKRRLLYSILCGAATAASVYCRPSWLYFFPFAFVFVMLSSWFVENFRKDYRTLFVSHGISFAIFIALMMPWWLRNYHISGHFVSTTLQMGASLYDGISPEATGASDMIFVDEFKAAELETPSMNPATETYEYRLDRRMKTAAMQFAIENPSRALWLACIKFVRMWNIWPNEASFSSLPIKLAVLITYVPILIGAICGGVLTFKRGFSCWILWIPAIYLTLLHLVFVSSLRYRTPVLLVFAILAAFALVQTFSARNDPVQKQ